MKPLASAPVLDPRLPPFLHPGLNVLAHRHGGFIFLDVFRMSPIGHVVAFAGKNIELAQTHGPHSLTIVPPHAAVNGAPDTPSRIHFAPNIISPLSIITTFDQLGLGVGFKVFQSLSRIAPILRRPDIIRTTGWTSLCKVCVELFVRESAPEPLRIFKIEKAFRRHLLLRLGATHSNNH